jgi:uncharacterized protein YndB with AHSA1/START domain
MVYNMHERLIPASPERAWDLLMGLGGEGDRLWPQEKGRFHLPEGVRPGAPVEHGPMRYRVGAVEPCRRLWFETREMTGGHGFTLRPAAGGTLVRHEIKGRTTGLFRLLWPVLIRWQHDAVLERLLDNLEREAGRATTG